MTIKECYEIMNANYEEALNRLMTDALIERFVGKFLNDPSFNKLTAALEEENYEEAFNAAHTLKGVSQNMAFDALSAPVSALTEDLRSRQCSPNTASLYDETKKAYEHVIKTIQDFQAS